MTTGSEGDLEKLNRPLSSQTLTPFTAQRVSHDPKRYLIHLNSSLTCLRSNHGNKNLFLRTVLAGVVKCRASLPSANLHCVYTMS